MHIGSASRLLLLTLRHPTYLHPALQRDPSTPRPRPCRRHPNPALLRVPRHSLRWASSWDPSSGPLLSSCCSSCSSGGVRCKTRATWPCWQPHRRTRAGWNHTKPRPLLASCLASTACSARQTSRPPSPSSCARSWHHSKRAGAAVAALKGPGSLKGAGWGSLKLPGLGSRKVAPEPQPLVVTGA